MEKIFSARMDEAYIYRLKQISEILHASKKASLEKAIDMLWAKLDANDSGVFNSGFGIWKDRKGNTEELSSKIKAEFRKSYDRNHE